MAKFDKSSKGRCKICSAHFKGYSELAEHYLAAKHPDSQRCKHCIRWFSSTKALAQHEQAKHGKLPQSMPSQNLDSDVLTTEHQQQFRFKDQAYNGSNQIDMATLEGRLISKCHSAKRLRKEGYILISDLSQELSRKGNERGIKNQTAIAPYSNPSEPKRKAVALDCEMAGVGNGESEIISISVVDFFSGQVLINSLVKPQQPIIEWRTNIHGIRPATLSIAIAQGQVLRGWEATRQELFKHINTDTVIVGQSLQQDLKRLRISHGKILDTAILTSEAVFGTDARFHRRWSLQSLCSDLLKLRIRQGSNTHDALEDAMAAREVAFRCLCYPDKLKQWGERARKTYYIGKANQARRKREREKQVHDLAPAHGAEEDCDPSYHQYGYGDDNDYDNEILRWEDVVDWDAWPKSPPSSD